MHNRLGENAPHTYN